MAPYSCTYSVSWQLAPTVFQGSEQGFVLIPVPWLMGGHTTFEEKKKKEKDEYNASSFCLTMQLVFHKVTPVTIICAYSKNEHNEVPHRKNPPLLF